MYIWRANKKRCNHYAPYTDEQGTRHTRVPPDLYEEIADPVRESYETHYVQEIDEYPYVINTPKPPEMLERQQDDKDAASAKQHLSDTDYLFLSDRHDKLRGGESEREQDLKASREAAREVLRAHKIKYPALV